MTTNFHLIIGAGAVGAGTALRLAEAGHEVRLVTRSGSGPIHERIERVAADATDAARLAELATGAHAIYNCANPEYSAWATDWPPLNAAMIAAAERTGARLIVMGNLYGYAAGSSPMSAGDPLDPPTRKGAIRTQMWNDVLEAHRAGRLRAAEVRASDFFGPGIGDTAHMGDRVLPRVLAGKSVSMVGPVDQPHSWTYMGDVTATLVAVGTNDAALGRAWHVPTLPAMTAKQLVDAISDAAGLDRVKVRQLPRLVLKLAGAFVADLREMREMLYQFDEAFIIESDETTSELGLVATPLAEQLRATIESYSVDAAMSGSPNVSASLA